MRHLAFDYQITRSSRKTLAIQIKNGQVEVKAPNRVTIACITDFITEKSAWVHNQLEKQQHLASEVFNITHGSTIPILGENKQIQCVPSLFNQVTIKQDTIYLFCKETNQENIQLIFHDWLKKQAENHITPRVQTLVKKLNLRHRLNGLRFRKTKTKWGHCTPEGTLQFNWIIMLAPESVVNYLIIHEVCHLAHLNHSKAYWHLVASIDPDYRISEQWLKQNQHKFNE